MQCSSNQDHNVQLGYGTMDTQVTNNPKILFNADGGCCEQNLLAHKDATRIAEDHSQQVEGFGLRENDQLIPAVIAPSSNTLLNEMQYTRSSLSAENCAS
jgi:hypothetical protein